MKVFYKSDFPLSIDNPVVTTGTFDGVHKGHRSIIERLKESAEAVDGRSVLITFSPHPRHVLFPDDNELRLLNTNEEKIELLKETGLDYLVIYPFTMEFSRISALEYVRDFLVNEIGAKKLIVGYNHQFGRNREGSFSDLVEYGGLYGFEVEEIPAQDIRNVAVSSTKIRGALAEGNVKLANLFLCANYKLNGKVVEGSKTGRKIGFPTANIQVSDKRKLIPADGVYAVKVVWEEKEYKGMLNIGVRPTLGGTFRTIEVHILDFETEIYGQEVLLEFVAKIRKEIKFNGLDQLGKQLEKDKEMALGLLS